MHWHALLGLVVFPLLAWGLGEHRNRVRWRLVGLGLLLQVFLAAALLYLPVMQAVFGGLNQGVLALQEATEAGTTLVFGYLGGETPPFEVTRPEHRYILAFRALPLLLVVSALSAVLFHWGVVPRVVRAASWALQRTLGIGGALGIATAANIFVGMTEAPLLIRPYLQRLTRSELFAVMTVGMATIAGTVLVIYASTIAAVVDDALGHLLIASLISAPAGLAIAELMVPETETPTHGDTLDRPPSHGTLDAVTRGTLEGVQLVINIIALLIVFVALVHLVNSLLGLLPEIAGEALTLERILGGLLAPVAWLMGIPWEEAVPAGGLLGTKLILNEFLAYLQLVALPEATLSAGSERILTYALCGFANLGSLGILIGGLGTLVPERRGEIAALGLRAVLAGFLTTCMTGAVIGLMP